MGAEMDYRWPGPCFRRRLRGKYRWQIVVRAADPRALLAEWSVVKDLTGYLS